MGEKFLARHTTASLYALLGGKKPVVALVPIGSTEPHGPHLGLGTDVVISAAACVRACDMLEKKGPLTAVIAPAVSYGVTDELGSAAVENRCHVKRLHATILHQLGFDPNRLTYFYGGLDQKLVGVEGAEPIKEVIA